MHAARARSGLTVARPSILSMTRPVPANPLAYIVSQVAGAAELEPEAQALLTPDMGPRDYVAAMAEAEMYVDALKFLAHLLPRREAVWLGWLCAKKELEKKLAPGEEHALAATERWIREPTDANRRAALDAATAAGLESPAGCAALGAYLSGGSMAPAELEAVPPPRYATARAVFGCLILTAVQTEPEKSAEKYKKYLADGLELAERIDLWNSVDRAAQGALTPRPA